MLRRKGLLATVPPTETNIMADNAKKPNAKLGKIKKYKLAKSLDGMILIDPSEIIVHIVRPAIEAK